MDARPGGNYAVIGEHGNPFVFQRAGQPIAFFDIRREPVIGIIVGNLIVKL